MTDTVGFVRKLPHQLVEAFRRRSRSWPRPTCSSTSSTRPRADPEAQIDAVRDGARRDRRRRRARAARASTRPTSAPRRKRLVDRHPGSVAHLGRHRRGHRRAAAHDRRPAAGRSTTVVELLVPYDRGDVLAAVHREGEVLVEAAEDDGMRLRARLDDTAQSKLRPLRRRRRGPSVGSVDDQTADPAPGCRSRHRHAGRRQGARHVVPPPRTRRRSRTAGLRRVELTFPDRSRSIPPRRRRCSEADLDAPAAASTSSAACASFRSPRSSRTSPIRRSTRTTRISDCTCCRIGSSGPTGARSRASSES